MATTANVPVTLSPSDAFTVALLLRDFAQNRRTYARKAAILSIREYALGQAGSAQDLADAITRASHVYR